MKKKIYLVRHAKSSWTNASLKDIDRPLKGIGVKNAYDMAKLLSKKKVHPELIISSPATRALHTAIIFARELKYPIQQIVIDSMIYESSKESLLKVITDADDKFNSIMVFGHDPSLTNLANHFIVEEDLKKIPTGGITGINFEEENWKNLLTARGKLAWFEYPKKGDKK